ncbi:MAG: hypothetical protein ABSC04_21135 [Syntrophobacteraceae bacterium]|jgi:deoxycytidine triphosphate deaminase
MRDNHALNTHKDKKVSPGMLSSPHIRYYVEKYEILDIDSYEETCLESASYNMRIGGNILTWYEGARSEFTLGPADNVNANVRKSVELTPNSLTFVTTIEKFQLPKDIIARFNLKSKWVHQGLLLGTGPIVDPQLHGHLLIPVHNFSTQTVTMSYGDELISVEFTKTLDPDGPVPLDSGKENKYRENDHWDPGYSKYREKIINLTVESSVQSQFLENKKQIELWRNAIEKTLDQFKKWGGFGIAGAIFAFLALFITTCTLLYSNYEKADTAYNLVKQYDKSSSDFQSLKSDYEKLQKELRDIKQYTERIANESDLKYAERSRNLIELRAKLTEMESQIKMLQNNSKKIESRGNQK